MTSEGPEDVGCYDELPGKKLNSANEISSLVTKDEDSPGSTSGLWALPRREKFILLALTVSKLVGAIGITILAPFFPKEAMEKGMSEATVRWVVAVDALTQLIVSPIFGRILPHFGCKRLIIYGEIFSGIGFICFGFLVYAKDETVFACLCFLFRILSAAGCAASGTAGFAIISQLFQGHLSSAYGMLEAAFGIGWMIGPAIGGFLHWCYGFPLPTLLLGFLVLAMVPIYRQLIPEIPETMASTDNDDVGGTGGSCRLLRLLLHPTVIVLCFTIVVVPLLWSNLQLSLEPHLQSFNVTDIILGGIFFMCATTYAFCCLIAGWITDQNPKLNYPLTALGLILCSCALLFLGPSPILTFLHQENIFWLNLATLTAVSIFASFSCVPLYNMIIESVGSRGEMNRKVYGAIAGLYNASIGLGEFLGPTLGGYLLDSFGFPWTMTGAASFFLTMGICTFVLWIFELRRPR